MDSCIVEVIAPTLKLLRQHGSDLGLIYLWTKWNTVCGLSTKHTLENRVGILHIFEFIMFVAAERFKPLILNG